MLHFVRLYDSCLVSDIAYLHVVLVLFTGVFPFTAQSFITLLVHIVNLKGLIS